MFGLLRGVVLRGNATLPSQNDPAITNLARALRIVRSETLESIEPWRDEPDRIEKIAKAIEVLTALLPRQLDYFAGIARGSGRRLERAEARIVAFKKLVTSAQAARAAGMPMALNDLFFPIEPITKWTQIAQDLRSIFKAELPDRPEEAAYRFVAAVIPKITGETPTLEAVKTAFKKRRLVDRGRRPL